MPPIDLGTQNRVITSINRPILMQTCILTYPLPLLGSGAKIYTPSGRSAEILPGIIDLTGRLDLVIVAILLISIILVG